MIYDQVEVIAQVVDANYAADMAALVAAKSLTGITTTATVIKRQSAETFRRLGAPLPAIGVVHLRAATQAKDQQKRDTLGTVVLDYVALGADASKVAKQAELAAEALMRSVDRLAMAGGGLYGAAELAGAALITMTEGFTEAEDAQYWRRAQVQFTCHDRDEGL
jgi:hypothetical protein